MREEVAFDEAALLTVLRSLPKDSILVGGQALAFWVDYLGLGEIPSAALTRDVDILGDRSTVATLAGAVDGKAVYPDERALTALAGQVILSVSPTLFRNIDVLHRVYGFTDIAALRQHSPEFQLNDTTTFQVIHPVDLMASKLKNYHKLPEKKTAAGLAQAALSLKVVRRYIEAALEANAETAAKNAIRDAAKVLCSSAGVHLGRQGVDLLVAIPHEIIKDERFHTEFWPRLSNEIEQKVLHAGKRKNPVSL